MELTSSPSLARTGSHYLNLPINEHRAMKREGENPK
jgi:hypothetical protein